MTSHADKIKRCEERIVSIREEWEFRTQSIAEENMLEHFERRTRVLANLADPERGFGRPFDLDNRAEIDSMCLALGVGEDRDAEGKRA